MHAGGVGRIIGEEPTLIGQHHDVADIGVGLVMEPCGDVGLTPGAQMGRMAERIDDAVLLPPRLSIDVGGEVALNRPVPRGLEPVAHTDLPLGLIPRHAVVGDDDEVDAVAEARPDDALPQRSEQRVHLLHGPPHLPRLRSEVVARLVRLLEVSHDEVGRLRRRELGNDAVGPLRLGHVGLLLVLMPPVGVLPVDGHVAARPIEHRRMLALPLRRQPERLTFIILRVELRLRVAQREAGAGLAVEKRVGDDAVVLGSEAGDQRIVVGEGLRRKRRHQLAARTPLGHAVEEWRIVPLGIVPAEAVEGDEDGGAPGCGADGDARQQQHQPKGSKDVLVHLCDVYSLIVSAVNKRYARFIYKSSLYKPRTLRPYRRSGATTPAGSRSHSLTAG